MTGSQPASILVAEDDPGLRYASAKLLSRPGYRVLEAADGIAAFRIAEQEASDLHMLVTNVDMPGMSGHELPRQVISGENEGEFPPEADALLKPVEPEILVQKVRELLGNQH